jgi:hypothetical protein
MIVCVLLRSATMYFVGGDEETYSALRAKRRRWWQLYVTHDPLIGGLPKILTWNSSLEGVNPLEQSLDANIEQVINF